MATHLPRRSPCFHLSSSQALLGMKRAPQHCTPRQVEDTTTCDKSLDPSFYVQIKIVMLTGVTCHVSEFVAPQIVRSVEFPSLCV
ncbi:hypothetical protein AVEN_29263-1 [Araneus ventricosus]|uniref:Uncharacterized protein n=1 Tax=Araneus ventricosus TaxID=182803 RepID=A0A4Y2IPK8_ARAVE|nr:hypothetical protein AVEN_29263-1 [Araneus ventricosus]